AVAGLDAPGVDDDVVRRRPRALDLQVAADAAPQVRDPVRIGPAERRGRRILTGAERAPDHRDERLRVRAVVLVLVRQPAAAVLRGRPVLVALLRECGHRARLRLAVDARHDHDAVVVARGGDGGLDLVIATAREELL